MRNSLMNCDFPRDLQIHGVDVNYIFRSIDFSVRTILVNVFDICEVVLSFSGKQMRVSCFDGVNSEPNLISVELSRGNAFWPRLRIPQV